MFIVDILSWWYSRGWQWSLGNGQQWVKAWDEMFDVKIIGSTLFEPWRQTVTVTPRDSSLDMHIKALLDNLVSRGVGFFIRVTTLIVALISVLIIVLAIGARTLMWPLILWLPLLLTIWYVI